MSIKAAPPRSMGRLVASSTMQCHMRTLAALRNTFRQGARKTDILSYLPSRSRFDPFPATPALRTEASIADGRGVQPGGSERSGCRRPRLGAGIGGAAQSRPGRRARIRPGPGHLPPLAFILSRTSSRLKLAAF